MEPLRKPMNMNGSITPTENVRTIRASMPASSRAAWRKKWGRCKGRESGRQTPEAEVPVCECVFISQSFYQWFGLNKCFFEQVHLVKAKKYGEDTDD
jgi:hypothetical protein